MGMKRTNEFIGITFEKGKGNLYKPTPLSLEKWPFKHCVYIPRNWMIHVDIDGYPLLPLSNNASSPYTW